MEVNEKKLKEGRTAKGGRPTKEAAHKRVCTISIRTTISEYEQLKMLADGRSQSVANLVRDLYQGGKVIMLTGEQEQSLMQLAGMANNLNQLTRLAHMQGLPLVAQELEATTRQLNNLLNQWSPK